MDPQQMLDQLTAIFSGGMTELSLKGILAILMVIAYAYLSYIKKKAEQEAAVKKTEEAAAQAEAKLPEQTTDVGKKADEAAKDIDKVEVKIPD